MNCILFILLTFRWEPLYIHSSGIQETEAGVHIFDLWRRRQTVSTKDRHCGNVMKLNVEWAQISWGSGLGGRRPSVLLPMKCIIVRSLPWPPLALRDPTAWHTDRSVLPPTQPGACYTHCIQEGGTHNGSGTKKYKYTHRWTDKEANTAQYVVDVHSYTHKPEENKNPSHLHMDSVSRRAWLTQAFYNCHLCRLVSVSQRLSHEGDFCIPWQWLTGGFISMVANCQNPSRALLWQGRRSQRSASAQCAKATQRADQATQPDIRAGNDDSWALWPSCPQPASLSPSLSSTCAGVRLRRSRIMSHVCTKQPVWILADASVTPTGLIPVVLTGLITCISAAFYSGTAFMVQKARSCGQLRKVSQAYVFSACYKFQSEITSCYLFIFTLRN